MEKVTYKAYRFRLYPTKEQEIFFAKHFGCSRFVYNYFLNERIKYYTEHKNDAKKGLTYIDTQRMLVELKNQPETIWLKEVNSQTLQVSLQHLDTAFNNFFKGISNFPKFKKKSHEQKFSVPQSFKISGKELFIPKLKSGIKFVKHREIVGTPKSLTICKRPSGKYFVSILCAIKQEVVEPKPVEFSGAVGIDLGIKHFAVLSNGEKIESPKYLRKSEILLKRRQKKLSRKVKGSKNFHKQRVRVARLYERISNQRDDFLHKLSHRLVCENQALFFENLNVQGMLRNHRLAKSISDASWSKFQTYCKYKAENFGKVYLQIGRFEASSRTCSKCGHINKELTLDVREWKCTNCNTHHDRDVNAAKNILNLGYISYSKLPTEYREVMPVEKRKTFHRKVEAVSAKQETDAFLG